MKNIRMIRIIRERSERATTLSPGKYPQAVPKEVLQTPG